jgi:hypothetical protein
MRLVTPAQSTPLEVDRNGGRNLRLAGGATTPTWYRHWATVVRVGLRQLVYPLFSESGRIRCT